MAPKEATLLDYSEEGRALLSQQSSVPLEGFATHAVDVSITEFMKDAKNEVEKGHLYLLWHLLYVEEVLEDVAENAIIDGAYDCGIDAYLVDTSEKRIRLFQSKYGEAHSIGEIDKFIKDVDRFKKLEQSKIRRDELQYLWKHLHEKNMKTELVYVTDNDVDEYESNEVKVVGKEQVYQILWERIKKPAKGEKSSLRIQKYLEHDNALCCIVSAFEYADFLIIAIGKKSSLSKLYSKLKPFLNQKPLSRNNQTFLKKQFNISKNQLSAAQSKDSLEDIIVEKAAVLV